MFDLPPFGRRFSFVFKCAALLALVALGDVFFYGMHAGTTLGLFALAWTGAVAVLMPGVRRHRGARLALACAAALSLALADEPSLLAAWLFWVALMSAVLLPLAKFHDAVRFGLRLTVQGFAGLFQGLRDGLHLLRLPRPLLRNSVLALVATFGLPLAGAAVFIMLFANANPVVQRLLSFLPWPGWDWFAPGRCVLWTLLAVLVWPTLRPSRLAIGLRFPGADKIANRPLNLPGVSLASITLSLALFNIIFAIENGLDAVFLWSGAPLPHGITLADYAHRGAYPLIVTALLAGLFVLVTAQPDSAIGRNALVRRLVVAWIVQNVVLVASSVIRTMDYVDAYMMTELRLAALIWMGLVAVGLALICWRMIARLPLRWLINTLALAAAIVLGSLSVIDLGTVAAQWNVAHAREAGGSGQPLDLGYLHQLGASALVPLAQLERTNLPPDFRDRVAFVRETIVWDIRNEQRLGWTWRAARRLDAAAAILGPKPHIAAPTPFGRADWDGTPNPPPPQPAVPPATPLTGPAGQ